MAVAGSSFGLPRTQETRGHPARRFFIGPLPGALLAVLHEVVQATDDPFDTSYVSSVRDVLDRNAHAFFVRRGGRAEDWDDEARDNVRDELTRRWQECPWTRSLRHNITHHTAGATHWVGTSFAVGSILGVNVLGSHAPTPSVVPEASQQESRAPYASTTAFPPVGFWAVQSHMSPPSPRSPHHLDSSAASLPEQPGGDITALSSGSPLLETASAPVLPTDRAPQQRSDVPRSILKQVRGASSSKQKGKRRSVSLLDRDIKRKLSLRPKRDSEFNCADPARLPSDGEQANEGHVSLGEALARSGSDVVECSDGATADAAPPQPAPSDIFLRDRMLVRVCYTKSESLSVYFDEAQNRQTTHLLHEDCMEFLVVWRNDMLELYEDYTIPGKEYIMGHKHLAFLIPLASERTSVSLYSFVDLTFCILCAPTPVRERHSKTPTLFNNPKEGTNVFVFKVKSRSRARDWLWHLWRRLGGKIPSSIDIHCPDIDMRISIDVLPPTGSNADKLYSAFSHTNIIGLAQRSLSAEHASIGSISHDWGTVIKSDTWSGNKLRLAWRFGGQLDWLWWERDVEGNARPWSVISGLSLRQGMKPAHLELRIAEHVPDWVRPQNGKKIYEPPAVEGYLNRIKQQGCQRVYLVTNGGNLISLLPTDANPPLPPSAHLSRLMSGSKPSVDEYAQTLFENEVWRGAEQIRTAQGTLDLRNIRAVRRAYGPLAQDDDEHVSYDVLDARDEGGHHGHVQAHNKVQLRLRRAFDVVLASGSVIRFEAHSANDCIEWVTRLRALVAYWSQRHREDVKNEMDVAFASGTRARLTPRTVKCTHGTGYPSPPEPAISAELPVLTSLYNWCALSPCRSIVKAGRVFVRKGLRGQYKLVQLFLIPGRLTQFYVSSTSVLHHRSTKVIGLLDAYVCSGYFAALALRAREYGPELPNLPRRYQDGLETDEREEDELFVIWHRKSSSSAAALGNRPNIPAGGFQPSSPIPPLAKKSHKLVVFRARSKTERDAWCWALGCEIERVVRKNMDREQRVREAGGLVDLSN